MAVRIDETDSTGFEGSMAAGGCRRSVARAFAVLLVSSVLCSYTSSCTSKNDQSPKQLSDQLLDRGRRVYTANCIACHNANPAIDGSLGPAIAGSSLELVHARVINGAYPPGYKPKRASKLMPAFPQLKEDAPALHAFLNQK